ncbi:cutinase family protein [Aspergillus clavatus NRRL 1]|uniref:Probable cutinase 3 n=1 Tax=Aspergillus clavatus (strain ATCC 1007 / CBS 513.65 / DSM 816 / NCTC 3887 / NRRL 1 / QM 1276 / 107) TaxID=344612 RepID=CUTI3_ASPCL|nr:cutinase, putative [Aspergillus clavatus NRRL 1]A1C9G0.1 RecName: Full=Probable cutinase 3; AltName: Full=Cutin hydrolase 3; Flags: Precursor [Aspergillus clavatus NRRL 1]EAW13484.1 cutinase, putative [Aspergillus clavatus NRRL 1]
MHFRALLVSALATLAMAAPAPTLEARQSLSSNELENGPCRDVTFIFARGSTEQGNMGFIVGPPTCTALKLKLGSDKVACQGVGGAYTANLLPNFLSQNTDPKSIAAATDMFQLARTKCPNTKIVTGGYSQGSAVIDNSVKALDDDLKSRVKAAVLFGFTRNVVDRGQIPNYPKDQVKVYCAVGDMVCYNTLIITAAHLTYGIYANDAANFLVSKL